MHPRLPLLLLASLSACAVDLNLPARPDESAPEITSFSPTQGVASTRVTVVGHHFLPDARVRFGDRAEVPATVAPDGASLVAEVPEDARTGRITVSVGARTATSETEFTYLGIDHLPAGRMLGTVDMRAWVERVVPLAGDRFGMLLGAPYETFLSPDRLGWLELGGARIVWADADAAGERLVLLDESTEPGTTCTSSAAHLWVVDEPYAPTEQKRRTCLPLNPGSDVRPTRVVVEPGGTHALVYGGATAYLVRLDDPTGLAVSTFDVESYSRQSAS